MAQISIISRSKIEGERFDAEFYLPKYLTLIQDLKTKPHDELGTKFLVTSGSTPPDRDNSLAEGILLLKTQNIREGYIDITNNASYIDERLDEQLRATRVRSSDILMNIVGANLEVLGRSAVVPSDFPRANITQAMALIRIKEESKSEYLPEYVFAFLLSKYGQLQIARLARPMSQYNVNHQEVRSVLLPKIPIHRQEIFREIFTNFWRLWNSSIAEYEEAARFLNNELGVSDWKPSRVIGYSQTLKEAQKAERLDAEHFHPDYEKAIEIVKEYPSGYAQLGNIIESLTNGVESRNYSEIGVPYIRVNDLVYGIIDYSSVEKIPVLEADRLKHKISLKEGDVLLSRSGTLALSAYVRQEDLESILSSHIFRLRLNDERFLPEYVSLFLRTTLGKMQILKFDNGAVVPEISQQWVKRIVIPVLEKKKQESLKLIMRSSSAKREEAKQTIRNAVATVEEAVERL